MMGLGALGEMGVSYTDVASSWAPYVLVGRWLDCA